ncbi:MAG: hypothetical protein RIQ60_2138 [Pseudomonadota bacterium]|jgi:UDP-glucose:(heptosyl)LPS alpha-1,3-glucosyltransferase
MNTPTRLRIAILSRHFDAAAGGAERYSVAVATALKDRHDIHVFSQSTGSPEPDGLTLHRIPTLLARPRWLNQLAYALICGWLTRQGFDAIHSHENTWTGDVHTVHVRTFRGNVLGRRTTGAAMVAWLKLIVSPRLLTYYFLERARFSRGAGRQVVVVSSTLADDVASNYVQWPAEDLPIVPPGLPAAVACSAQDRLALRQELGLQAHEFVLLHVSNDHRKKGLDTLLAALPSIETRLPVLRLVVVGSDRDSTRSAALARKLNVQTPMTFVGKVTNPQHWYQAADMLVHPAFEDTFGMVVSEAMSHGLPVIVSPAPWCGIAADLAGSGAACLLSHPSAVTELGEQIVRLAADAAERQRLSAAARQFAQRYDWEVAAAAYEAMYRRVAAQKRG